MSIINNAMQVPKRILPTIVIAQFCCTSLWFAGNAVMDDLVQAFQLQASALGHLTSAVQFGFISGTLVFALLTIADRFAPSRVFFVCAILGAIFNLLVLYPSNNLGSLLLFRGLTGFCLAGIYPVGMKIASDYYQKGLGLSLSFLVGALVLGTAFPHLLKGFSGDLPWRSVIIFTSVIAALGGLFMLLLVPNGPFRKPSQGLDLSAIFKVFNNRQFRSAAFGYFGHMWELYAFWTFVPLMLISFQERQANSSLNIPVWCFLIIGLGGLACVVGGYISQRLGTKRTAFFALLFSGFCCLLSPFILQQDSVLVLLAFLLFWGWVVIADSPLFSTLVAQNAKGENRGTALTIVNCIGFAITIVSIQTLNLMIEIWDPSYIYVLLAIGPIMGLMALRQKSVS